ncbi:MAG TPA: MerR family transcriptional regulator [Herpetosiphonaceae bacterium]
MPFEREYKTSEATQKTGLGERQLRRYVVQGKLRSRRSGRDTFYNADDIDRLSAERGRSVHAAPPEPTTDIMPASEIFQYLQDRQEKLDAALLEIGRLQGRLEAQQKLLEDRERLQQRVEELQAELDAVRQEAQGYREAQATIARLEAQLARLTGEA